MKQTLMIVTLILASVVLGAGYQNPPTKGGAATQQKPAQKKDAAPEVPEGYVIGPGDTLNIDVWGEPRQSNPQALVRPDGMITMPMIGDIKAVGLTTNQLVDAVTKKLSEVLTAPAVTVSVVRIESQKVYIVGNVMHPGTFSWTPRLTVLQLIALAGGLDPDRAHPASIKIMKADNTWRPFNYKEVTQGRSLWMNIYLENGDTVIVP